MQQIEVRVLTSVGLHARPAVNLVHAARVYKAEVFLEKSGRRVSAKSLVSVLSLGIKAGEQVAVLADGVDAAEALAAIGRLAADNFGEGDNGGGV